MKSKIMVTKSSMPSLDEYVAEIADLWDSHILTNMGEKHKALESKLKEYLKVKNVSLMVNGHMALELAIQALNLTGEVITTPFTFASTTHAIVRNGLQPVFCDINPIDYTIDADKIEELITDKTCAIVPVHVYGNICDVDKIQKIAAKHGLKVIYDAAHAFGEEYNGIGIGNYGDASIFSFHATKVFNTIEGGAVTYNGEEYGLDLYRLKNFGIRNKEKVDFVGSNAKMNEFQAAMGLCNLRHVDTEIAKRKNVFKWYCEYLKNIPGLYTLQLQENVRHNYSYFPICIDKDAYGKTRDELYDALEKEDINARKYFYPLTSAFDCFHGMYRAEDTPIALRISQSIMTLPMYADLTKEQVYMICEIIHRNAKKSEAF